MRGPVCRTRCAHGGEQRQATLDGGRQAAGRSRASAGSLAVAGDQLAGGVVEPLVQARGGRPTARPRRRPAGSPRVVVGRRRRGAGLPEHGQVGQRRHARGVVHGAAPPGAGWTPGARTAPTAARRRRAVVAATDERCPGGPAGSGASRRRGSPRSSSSCRYVAQRVERRGAPGAGTRCGRAPTGRRAAVVAGAASRGAVLVTSSLLTGAPRGRELGAGPHRDRRVSRPA